MNLLAFDTSTDTLSIAVQRADATWEHSGPGGAQASATLLPAIRALLAEAGLSFDTLDAVVFGRGPGSFTGLRTACSVAQGLAFGARGGAGVPVLPIDTLLAMAEAARHAHGCTRVVAVLDARMDEVYTALFEFRPTAPGAGATISACARRSPWPCRPATPWPAMPARPMASGSHPTPPRVRPADRPRPAAPGSRAHRCGGAQPASEALPLYVRDKVAQTTAERLAARQAAAAALPPILSAP